MFTATNRLFVLGGFQSLKMDSFVRHLFNGSSLPTASAEPPAASDSLLLVRRALAGSFVPKTRLRFYRRATLLRSSDEDVAGGHADNGPRSSNTRTLPPSWHCTVRPFGQMKNGVSTFGIPTR